MISFIVCSISPEKAEALKQNIQYTIGDELEFEFIAFDNRQTHYGITKVYNSCARKAKYDYLCFLHEDVAFHTKHWGKYIIKQLDEPNCGVIGFSGASVKSQYVSSVQHDYYSVDNYIQRFSDRKKEYVNNLPCNTDFAPCVTLDGMCLFVHKRVWRQHPFDEQLLTGFHGYDLDFSLQIAEHYQNYVANYVTVEHFSRGSFNAEWTKTVILLHQKKWKDKLPLSVKGISSEEARRWDADTLYKFLKSGIRAKYPLRKLSPYIKQYWEITRFRQHSVSLLLKIIGRYFLRTNV